MQNVDDDSNNVDAIAAANADDAAVDDDAATDADDDADGQGLKYSVGSRLSRHAMEFDVCRRICCLPQKNAELPVFCYIHI